MNKMILEAKSRKTTGKNLKSLRKENILPAVVYGHGVSSLSLTVGYLPFKKVYGEAGESQLIDLKIDDRQPVKVLIHDVQFHPVKSNFLHVDFYQVKMTEKITAEIVLKFVGESTAVKELGGVLVKNLDKIKISCLPADLIPELQVDISSLKSFDDIIYVKDLKAPEKLKVLEKADESVVLVVPPRSEEELKAMDEKLEEKVEEVEKLEKEKKEEDEEEVSAEAEPKAEEPKGKKEEKKEEKKK